MEKQMRKWYPLDNSAAIHMAVIKKKQTNAFRVAVTLREKVCPDMLQKALNQVTPRFPTIVAGIQRGFFQYKVVPVIEPPLVLQDTGQVFSGMTIKNIKSCAIQVYYTDNQISVECFHAITDGYGGIVFLNTLLAEYCSLRYKRSCFYTEQILNPDDMADDSEVSDDFLTYAGTHCAPANHRKVYRLPFTSADTPVHTVTKVYPVRQLLKVAHDFGVSLTVFLTSVLFEAVMKVQRNQMYPRDSYEPIQLLVPINLRQLFKSKSLRNFSLFALPCIEPKAESMPFERLVKLVSQQMKEQSTKENLSGMISTNVLGQTHVLFRIIPLPVKDIILRIIYHFYGERNSSMSISNLGEITYPEELEQYMERVEFILSPKSNYSCNCGIISYNGKIIINFTGKSKGTELEDYFFDILEKKMLM